MSIADIANSIKLIQVEEGKVKQQARDNLKTKNRNKFFESVNKKAVHVYRIQNELIIFASLLIANTVKGGTHLVDVNLGFCEPIELPVQRFDELMITGNLLYGQQSLLRKLEENMAGKATCPILVGLVQLAIDVHGSFHYSM